jgi:hypothetical protein
MRRLFYAAALAVLAACGRAEAQGFAQPVPMNEPDFGYGRIPASQARYHMGEQVTACGRASSVREDVNGLNFGNPGLYGTYAADLVVTFPPQLNPNALFGQVLCASGVVGRGENNVPTISVSGPQDVIVLGGVGPYMPSQPCRPNERQMPNGSCMPWRAPY